MQRKLRKCRTRRNTSSHGTPAHKHSNRIISPTTSLSASRLLQFWNTATNRLNENDNSKSGRLTATLPNSVVVRACVRKKKAHDRQQPERKSENEETKKSKTEFYSEGTVKCFKRRHQTAHIKNSSSSTASRSSSMSGRKILVRSALNQSRPNVGQYRPGVCTDSTRKTVGPSSSAVPVTKTREDFAKKKRREIGFPHIAFLTLAGLIRRSRVRALKNSWPKQLVPENLAVRHAGETGS